MEDNLKRPFVSSAWVSTKEEGSCNFCTERSYSKVLRIRSNHPMRNLSVRICKDCLLELKKVAFTSEERKNG